MQKKHAMMFTIESISTLVTVKTVPNSATNTLWVSTPPSTTANNKEDVAQMQINTLEIFI